MYPNLRLFTAPLNLSLSLFLLSTACSEPPELTPIADSPSPEPTGSLQGFITSLDGQPLSHVSVFLQGKRIATSSAQGAVSVSGLPLDLPLQLTLSRPGFSTTHRELILNPQRPTTFRASLQPSQDAVLDFAERGGIVHTSEGLQLDFPPNAVVDAAGNPVKGPVQLRYTLLDLPQELALAPGDFRAIQLDGSPAQLQSFGMAEVTLTQQDQPVHLAAPVTLRFPLFQSQPLYAGQSIGLYSFDTTAGRWIEEGAGHVIYQNSKPTFEATVSHFSWWNADVPLEDKNCMTGKAIDAQGNPLANLTVEATGQDYSGGSTTHTQLDGLFCVDVKRGSLNSLRLYGGTPDQLYELTTSDLQVPDLPTECNLGGCLELGVLTVPLTSDRDQDGYSVLEGDCNDDDRQVHPDATETCNGIDDDCDGENDEGFPERQTFYADRDADTFGDQNNATLACSQPHGYVLDARDCDDTRAYIYPDAQETCNGRDDDCDGTIDDGVTQETWPDADLDGYGSSTGASLQACGIPSGYTNNVLDCDDANPTTHVNALEVCDGFDNNCNGEVDEQVLQALYPDLDQDGYGDSLASPLLGCAVLEHTSLNHLDCDDSNPLISPEADELPNGLDDNCNALVDEAEAMLYRDLDGDGYGTAVGALLPINSPGYALLSGDCDDTEPTTHPSAPEVCDGVDNSCDGQADELLPSISLYLDADSDGYGAAQQSLHSCGMEAGYVLNGDDCHDQEASIHPNAAETCNGLDEDCDGLADEGFPINRFYVDADGDGYGDAASPVDACMAPPGTVSNGSDCDDGNAQLNPSILEQCDGIDQDCDGEIDEDVVRLYYTDADGDGYGDDTLGASCLQTETSVTRGGDCDDDNASSYPAAPDTAGDGIDQSCDGTDGLAPSVGLPGSSFTSIQAALDAASDGQTVWVGPGTYNEYGLNMQGKALRLASTAGQETTILDGRGLGTVVYFDSAETETSSVEGFTVTGGEASCNTPTGATSCSYAGGGMFLSYSSPTLKNVTFTGNTASGDYNSYGGGMYLNNSSPTLSNVTFTGNTAFGSGYALYGYGYGSGGGMYLSSSSPTLNNVTFTGNEASGYGYGDQSGSGYGYGGGMYLSSSSPTLNNVTFTGNTAFGSGDGDGEFSGFPLGYGFGYGGGMYLSSSSPSLKNVTFTGNTASGGYSSYGYGDGYGGGMYLSSSSPSLKNVTFTGNTASGDGYYSDGSGSGGGMYLDYSSPTLSNVTFTGNEANGTYGSGGGMYLSYSSPTLKNVTFTGNTASGTYGYGGGMYLSNSSPTLNNVTFTGNTAEYIGGGMYLRYSSPTLTNVILAYNTGLNLYVYSGTPVLSYTNLYQAYGASHNLTSLPPTVTELEPRFVSFSPDGDPSNDDLHLQPSSPLRDAGDPRFCTDSNASGCDPDGSLPDLGAYGGPQADFSGYQDSDQDGLYDSWELALAGNLTTLSGALDADADGLSDADELKAGTSPLMTDSDADGSSDGNEVAADKDPLNPFSVPGVEGLVALQVPSSAYPTLQAALNAIPAGREGYVKLAAGTLKENLTLSQKSVTVEGEGEGQTVLDGQQRDSVWKVGQAELNLSGVTVQNGKADSGAGMWLSCSNATLKNVTFTGNEASGDYGAGGGMYLDNSSPTLSNVTFTGNTAYSGGGMSLSGSSPTLSNVTFTGNTAEDDGGGMWLSSSSPTLSNVTFTGNTAYSGGGMRLSYSSPTLSNVTFTGNTAGYGGGMSLYESSPTLSNVTFTGNSAEDHGGGMFLSYSSPTLKNVTFTGNTADDEGGGMRLYESSPTLSNVTFTGNTADDEGGGMRLYESSPTLKNVILAYNRALSGGNFYKLDYDGPPSSVKATTSLFYNPSGWGTDNLTPTGTYLTVEPKFLDYADTRSGASCTPGTSTRCLPSDLHPALGSPLIDAGDPAMSDVDGSRADIGSYGGQLGDRWDVDGDGYFDYFWPGEWDEAPSGFDPADYDCDDLDPDVQGC